MPDVPSREALPSLVEYVYAVLRQRIIELVYAPGQVLRAGAVSEELGVSVIPVREALRKLEADRLVRIDPNRGASVTEISAEDLVQVYELRKVLEGAAIVRSAPRLTGEDLTAMRESLVTMEDGYERRDLRQALDAHRAFHARSYLHAGSPRMREMIEMLWDASDRYLWFHPAVLGETDFTEEHETLLGAMAAGDADASHTALQLHHDLAIERIKKIDFTIRT